jgi:hypothetical protein
MVKIGSTWVNEQTKRAFLGIPKNGTCFIRMRLKLSECIDFHLVSDDYFKFTIIRNPVDRIVSAYIELVQDCCHYPGGRFMYLDLPKPKVEFISSLLESDLDNETRFKEYLDYIQQKGFIDGHCVPQSIYLTGTDGNLFDTQQFKLEDLKPLEELVSIEFGKPKDGDQHEYNTTSNPALKRKLLGFIESDSHTLEQIKKIYSQDFEIWEAIK